MLRLAADEDFNGRIVRGVLRRLPRLDLLPVHEAGLSGADDRKVLEFAAREGRILLTHDASTMPRQAYERVTAGLPMPGVVICGQHIPIRQVIEDIVLLAECSDVGQWHGQVIYLPL
jgi:predicted nuclease of predicted toxin-antitoxin system